MFFICLFWCYRISKSNNSHSPEKSLEIPLEQGDSIVTKCFTINFDTNKKTADNTNEHKVPGSKEKKSETRTTSYKPPAIPNTNAFEAVVSCIGDDGTIFVVPKLSGKVFYKVFPVTLGLAAQVFWYDRKKNWRPLGRFTLSEPHFQGL